MIIIFLGNRSSKGACTGLLNYIQTSTSTADGISQFNWLARVNH